jgi:putative glycosyltransferase (TIGR04372 family)
MSVSEFLEDVWVIGKYERRPAKIFASLHARSFGEFIAYLFYVNSVAQQFDHSQITLLYRQTAAFKTDLVRLLPAGTTIFPTPPLQGLPTLDIISPRGGTVLKGMEGWSESGLDNQDIVITEGMATENGLLGFENLGYLSIPQEAVADCTEGLIKRGVKPDRWFCTVHARESGYPSAAKSGLRNADLPTYFGTIVHIIDQLGGQVVRIGHPEMTKFLQIDGLVQLGLEDNTTLLQAFAVSRSRFLLCGPTGPLALGDAFHVPLAYANAWGWDSPNDRALIRTIDLLTPEGTILNQHALVRAIEADPIGLRTLLNRGCEIIQNSPEEMVRLVNQVYEMTSDTPGWRAPDPPWAGPRPNQFVWPGRRRPRAQFISMPT